MRQTHPFTLYLEDRPLLLEETQLKGRPEAWVALEGGLIPGHPLFSKPPSVGPPDSRLEKGVCHSPGRPCR